MQLNRFNLTNLEKDEKIERPMIVVPVSNMIQVFTNSPDIEINAFCFERNDVEWQSIDGGGIVYKAVAAGDGMVLYVSKLTVGEDMLFIVSSDVLDNTPIQYESNKLTMSFQASEYSLAEMTFYQYNVCSEIGAGDFTYSLIWKQLNGDIDRIISIKGSVTETAKIQIYYDGESFIIQSDKDIVDPIVVTGGIRSNEYETTTIYPYVASKYIVDIFEDGTAQFTPGVSEILNVENEESPLDPTDTSTQPEQSNGSNNNVDETVENEPEEIEPTAPTIDTNIDPTIQTKEIDE